MSTVEREDTNITDFEDYARGNNEELYIQPASSKKQSRLHKTTTGHTSSFDQSQAMDRVTFRQISHVTCGVAMIDPTEKPFHYLIPPLKEKCFNDSEFSQLQQMYKLLYSNSSIISISHFIL